MRGEQGTGDRSCRSYRSSGVAEWRIPEFTSQVLETVHDDEKYLSD
jgi:hypothetical protein